MAEHDHCSCNNHDNSSFIFGLIIGLLIGAVIAILIYKNNKTEVFTTLEKKFKKFIGQFVNDSSTPSPSKKSVKKSPPATELKIEKQPVILPAKLIAKVSPSVTKKSPPKLFVKPKK